MEILSNSLCIQRTLLAGMAEFTYTPEQIREEYQYRIAERLGILCGSRKPTEAEIEIAEAEADEWLKSIS